MTEVPDPEWLKQRLMRRVDGLAEYLDDWNARHNAANEDEMRARRSE